MVQTKHQNIWVIVGYDEMSKQQGKGKVTLVVFEKKHSIRMVIIIVAWFAVGLTPNWSSNGHQNQSYSI